MTVATVGHMARARLLLEPIAAMGHMTSDDRCYCGARGTRVVSTSPHSNDGLSDISGSLLLPPIVLMGYMTLDGRCYCGYNNDGLAVRCYWTASSKGLSSAILSLLDCTVATT
jgi:hypothetical protein